MIKRSWKYNYTATLSPETSFSKFCAFFGMPSDPCNGPKNLSPLCMAVKVLGHTDLPFFIPTGLTALMLLPMRINFPGPVQKLSMLIKLRTVHRL